MESAKKKVIYMLIETSVFCALTILLPQRKSIAKQMQRLRKVYGCEFRGALLHATRLTHLPRTKFNHQKLCHWKNWEILVHSAIVAAKTLIRN